MSRPLTKSSAESAASFVEGKERSARIAHRRAIPAIKAQAPRRKVDERPKHERMPISREQIEGLRRGAVADRDRILVQVCDRAINGEEHAINACKGALYGLA